MKKVLTKNISLDPDRIFYKLQLAQLSSLDLGRVMGAVTKKAQHSLEKYEEHIREQSERDENLTPREFEILKHVAKGHTSQTISEKMHLSKHTVDTHRRNIIQKLNINSTMDWYWNARAMQLI